MVVSRTEWLGPEFTAPARRIVSIVPSLTDAVFRLGAGDRVVARTKFCVRPRGAVEGIETVRGTKNADVARIRELAPDIVLANREENTEDRVRALAETIPVWLTDPQAPADVPALWRELGVIVGDSTVGEARARETEAAAAEVAAGAGAPLRFVYYIWKSPWMAAGHGTYISNLFEAAGWRNALPADHTRFPELSDDLVTTVATDAHLFSSEPFAFELPRHLGPLGPARRVGEGVFALDRGGLALAVDGERASWYPSLTAEGLRYAAALAEVARGTMGR